MLPSIERLAEAADAWYVSHFDGLSAIDLDQPLDLAFTNGTPARMTHGEILYVCLHGKRSQMRLRSSTSPSIGPLWRQVN
jgi:hypothetical protein